ncbi:MAG: heme exporter protein CcmB [Terriglobia bacterium]
MATVPAGLASPTWRISFAILAKDFLAEYRTKEVFITMVVFGFMVAVIFSFAFEPTSQEAQRMVGGLVWLVFFFSGILGLNRSFTRETLNACLEGLRLAPADPGAIYLGKLLSNLVFMLLAELILLVPFAVLFDVHFWRDPFWLLVILGLGTWGFAALGTIFAAVSANTRMREFMLPLLVLPLCLPVLIVAVEVTTRLLRGLPMTGNWPWIVLLVACFDLFFTLLSWFVFEAVIEQ